MEKLRPCVAEFIGTFALIFVGIGAIKTAGHDVLAVALAHGLTIAAFVSATMHISGGHLNPAVTFGLVCGGHMTLGAAIRYWIAQLLGAISAAYICLGLFGADVVVNGTPQLATTSQPITPGQGILIEGILTFFLVFVVHGTGVDERGRRVAGLAIGSTVTLDILFGGPLTGAAMNPARVFGPAVRRVVLERSLRLLDRSDAGRRTRGIRLSDIYRTKSRAGACRTVVSEGCASARPTLSGR